MKNFMMEMEELVDWAVAEGASDVKEVASFVTSVGASSETFVDIEFCKTYFESIEGEVARSFKG